jgi:hypothetical protein
MRLGFYRVATEARKVGENVTAHMPAISGCLTGKYSFVHRRNRNTCKTYTWFLLAWIFLLGGCSRSGDFSAESYRLPGEATLEAEELFRIESPTYEAYFSYIRKIHVLDDGNLVVQNYPDHRLYELTPEGEFVGPIGRQGRGPGEFIETFISFLTFSDSLHVFDFNNSRHQIFTRDESGQWNYARESAFRARGRSGMQVQIPERIEHRADGELFGLFRVHPGSRDTLQAQYVYVSKVDMNIEHAGEMSRMRRASELAIHRGENNSQSVHNNLRFYNAFYNYLPDRDDVILVENTSNEIVAIDSTDNETVIGYLPYERFPLDGEKLEESLVNVNYYYSGMEEIVREKLLEHEPYYWNVILHEGRLWVNLARSDSSSPNWIITTLEGEVLEAFRGPEKISEVTISGNRIYGSEKDDDGATYLVGYELKEL